MNVMIILLRVLLITGVIVIGYMLWKTYSTQKWNRLLRKKQEKSGLIELRRLGYKKNYATIAVTFLFLFVSIANPIAMINLLSGEANMFSLRDADTQMIGDDYYFRTLTNNIDSNEGGVYIVEVKDMDVDNFNILYDSVNSEPTNVVTVDAEVVAELYYATSALPVNNTSFKLASTTQAINFNVDSLNGLEYDYMSKIEHSEVYLLIGNYVSVHEGNLNSDPRYQEGDYILTWEVIFLEGYDLSKGYDEQSEDIKRIIEEYTKDLD